VADSCQHGGEASSCSGATELVNYLIKERQTDFQDISKSL
jgi:hypothetical protein